MEEVKSASETVETATMTEATESGSVGVEQQAGASDRGDSVEISDPLTQLAAVTAERDQLLAEKAELQDRLLRWQAEFENYRRRSEREKAEMMDWGKIEAIRAVLPVVDDFERALKAETADKEYARGMMLIYQRLDEALKKLGLSPLETVGQKFDPNLHHAVEKFVTEEQEEDIVLEEYQKGYQFRDRLLRPAMVKVSTKSA
ncbi:MAG: nucleotide exchange factor GrpE [Bryobacteraceae bacterium]|nr:nucleotide exchange factor GrpE [Bryobacteraceae bacterium]MDW8380110.1 nucleotide exchange factor GrpE [Bryobacterales bacterium]